MSISAACIPARSVAARLKLEVFEGKITVTMKFLYFSWVVAAIQKPFPRTPIRSDLQIRGRMEGMKQPTLQRFGYISLTKDRHL